MKTKCPYCKNKETTLYDTKEIPNRGNPCVIDIMQCDKCGLYFGNVFEYKETITIPHRMYKILEKELIE